MKIVTTQPIDEKHLFYCLRNLKGISMKYYSFLTLLIIEILQTGKPIQCTTEELGKRLGCTSKQALSLMNAWRKRGIVDYHAYSNCTISLGEKLIQHLILEGFIETPKEYSDRWKDKKMEKKEVSLEAVVEAINQLSEALMQHAMIVKKSR
jgi:DNA-binding Lrp family transcriptional regulator